MAWYNPQRVDAEDDPMPIHDWTRVDEGLFHNFHCGWVCEIKGLLNTGGMPEQYSALLHRDRLVPRIGATYPELANRITIQHPLGTVIAVIEVVTPGVKKRKSALRTFVNKTVWFMKSGVHVLLIDLFPPSALVPSGLHPVIWDEVAGTAIEFPKDKPLIVTSYAVGENTKAYCELVAVGNALPDMPLFLEPDKYVNVRLEESYQNAWRVEPDLLKELLDPPDE
jgi:hypothetical protein